MQLRRRPSRQRRICISFESQSRLTVFWFMSVGAVSPKLMATLPYNTFGRRAVIHSGVGKGSNSATRRALQNKLRRCLFMALGRLFGTLGIREAAINCVPILIGFLPVVSLGPVNHTGRGTRTTTRSTPDDFVCRANIGGWTNEVQFSAWRDSMELNSYR